jgi:hypothetical protein
MSNDTASVLRLIGAAPDLLEVCERIARTSPVVRDADYNALVRAINKATGSNLPELSGVSTHEDMTNGRR